MFSSVRRFFKRHQRKFIIGGTFVGSAFFLMRYTQHKIREWQEAEIRAFVERTKKREHFKHLEETCNHITLTLVSSVREAIVKELNTRSIIDQLKNGTTDKITLWNKLKVLSIARSTVIIYAYTMLITFVRIQINLISGYIYINSTVDNIAGHEVQAKYLQLCTYFMSEGVQKLCNLVKSTVEQVTASISLDAQLTLRDLEQIYYSITSSIFADSENDPLKNLAHYMILQQDDKGKDASVYLKIIDQTLDLLESNEVQDLMQKNVRSGFVLLIDRISMYFGDSAKIGNGVSHLSSNETPVKVNPRELATSNGVVEFVDVNKTTMAMAKIIPIMSGQIPEELSSKDMSADWLQQLMLNNEIKMLGANIYEAISCQTNV